MSGRTVLKDAIAKLRETSSWGPLLTRQEGDAVMAEILRLNGSVDDYMGRVNNGIAESATLRARVERLEGLLREAGPFLWTNDELRDHIAAALTEKGGE